MPGPDQSASLEPRDLKVMQRTFAVLKFLWVMALRKQAKSGRENL